MKRIVAIALLFALVAAAPASAATKSVTGKITAIDGTKVTVVIDGEKADWVKKNGFVKFKVGPGKIIEVSAAGTSPVTIVVNTRKASDLKVNDTVTFEKGLAVSGC